jgi:hypothetical protein
MAPLYIDMTGAFIGLYVVGLFVWTVVIGSITIGAAVENGSYVPDNKGRRVAYVIGVLFSGLAWPAIVTFIILDTNEFE